MPRHTKKTGSLLLKKKGTSVPIFNLRGHFMTKKKIIGANVFQWPNHSDKIVHFPLIFYRPISSHVSFYTFATHIIIQIKTNI